MIRVLIINRQLVFAVTIKQALEQTGEFEVHPFTSASAALEFLRGHPHDIVLLDFTVTGTPGPEIVRQLRLIQPDIPIIVSPTQPGGNAFLRELDIQGMLNVPFGARTIIPLIKQSVVTADELPEDDSLDIHTRVLGSDEPPPDAITRILDAEAEEPAPEKPDTADFDPHTRVFDTDDDGDMFAPPSMPEFSSLDNVLAVEQPSEIYEPPRTVEDTPSVPETNSEALRQFLATKSDAGDSIFDELLSDIDNLEAAAEAAGLERGSSEFAELVNSMRGDDDHTPLPDRHQQFFEFILTGGMDSLLTEIEKRKTGPLEDPDAPASEEEAVPPDTLPEATPAQAKADAPPDGDVFQILAQDEPPMPTLEESGTIGDLMIGVSDTSFRNVLALMRGDEAAVVDEAAADAQRRAHEADEAFASFFDAGTDFEDDDPPEIPDPKTRPSDRGSQRDRGTAIPAQLILETALDESTPPESFSLSTLLDSIERQLTTYKPDVAPLPSWGRAFKLPRPELDDRYVREPDFLPEEFPSTEELMPPPALPEQAPAVPEFDFDEYDQVTQASVEQQSRIEADLQQDETEALPVSADWDDLPNDEDYWDAAAEAPAAEVDTNWPDAGPVVNWDDFAQPDADVPDEAEDEAEAPSDTEMTEEQAYFGDLFEAWPEDEATVIGTSSEKAVDAEPFTEPDFVPPDLPEWERDDFDMVIDESPDEATVMLERDTEPAVDLGAAAEFDVALDEYEIDTEDPYIAQLALSLTQVSLELAAEATLLTRDGEIMAYAGQLPEPEMDELRAVVTDEWEGSADEARVRFIKLAGSGNDYMLYSRKTDGDFTLWMIFAGSMPLREIRKQGKRLVDVLEAVPEMDENAFTMPAAPVESERTAAPVSPAPPVEAEPEALSPYAYVWLLRDPELELPPATVEAVQMGLRAWLAREGWQVRRIRMQGEYIYLLADVPGERLAYEVVNDLKQHTGDIIQRQMPRLAGADLWADCYLVVTPGRELDDEEISQFISFERML